MTKDKKSIRVVTTKYWNTKEIYERQLSQDEIKTLLKEYRTNQTGHQNDQGEAQPPAKKL